MSSPKPDIPDLIDMPEKLDLAPDDMPGAVFEAFVRLRRAESTAGDYYPHTSSPAVTKITIDALENSPIYPGDLIGLDLFVGSQSCETKTDFLPNLSTLTNPEALRLVPASSSTALVVRALLPGSYLLKIACESYSFEITLKVQSSLSPRTSIDAWFVSKKIADTRYLFGLQEKTVTMNKEAVSFWGSLPLDNSPLTPVLKIDQPAKAVFERDPTNTLPHGGQALIATSTTFTIGQWGSEKKFSPTPYPLLGDDKLGAITLLLIPNSPEDDSSLLSDGSSSVSFSLQNQVLTATLSARSDLFYELDDVGADAWIISAWCDASNVAFLANGKPLNHVRTAASAPLSCEGFHIHSLLNTFDGQVFAIVFMKSDTSADLEQSLLAMHDLLSFTYLK